MRGIVKDFPGVRALDGVELDVTAGEVHCLLGQNGAGKSTLIKVIAGAHRPDDGTVEWEGEPIALPNPTAAMRRGIATIYQELDLVDGLSVAENIFLGHERASAGFVRRCAAQSAAQRLLERLGHPEIPPGREVGRLAAAGKQVVSMARALSHNTRLIVMDEPSAVLDHDEVENLFRIIRGLAASGVSVVYISHRLAEIREIGDRVTVLKDGRTAAAGLDAATTPTADLVRHMTGRSFANTFPARTDQAAEPPSGESASEPGPDLLRLDRLSLTGHFHDISFSVRAGEIVGLAGLVGSGRSQILETILGARRASAGRVLVDGRPLRPGSPGAAVRAGIGLAPEERKSQALVMQASVAHNISLASLNRFSRFGFLDRQGELAEVALHTAKLQLHPADPRRPVVTLSGGNQQKAVVARWLLKGCRLLLLDEPTRGVDVGARAELYVLIRSLADAGVGVLLVSSEIPEVLGLADRVLVLREGRLLAAADPRRLAESDVLDMIMEGGHR
jgi:ribose transport system ATP-binding protein